MTLTPRGKLVLLAAGAAAGLAAVVMTAGQPPPTTRPGASGPASRRAAAAAAAEPEVSDVRLELLRRSAAGFDEADRNPFRFQDRPDMDAPSPAARTAPPGAAAAPSAPRPAAPAAPAGPPPPPPIPLRFIGLVDAPTQAGRVAVMSDGRGNVFQGKEGDTIEGRYRILQVGSDALEVAYLDGRGRQVIRLSGQ